MRVQASLTQRSQQVRIGDRVWLDTNGDGVQDVGERGIANVTLRLSRNGVNIVRSTVVRRECSSRRRCDDRRQR